jgi:hypothetical protein
MITFECVNTIIQYSAFCGYIYKRKELIYGCKWLKDRGLQNIITKVTKGFQSVKKSLQNKVI